MKRRPGRLTAFAWGFLLLILGILWQEPGEAGRVRDWLCILSNAALIPGFLLTGLGILMLVAEEHFFDGIKYAVGGLVDHLRNVPRTYQSYYDYIHREKKKSSASTLLLPGLSFLAAAVVLTVLYYL